jgi:hypothetical protein
LPVSCPAFDKRPPGTSGKVECKGVHLLEAKMTWSWICLFTAAFFFGVAVTIKIVTAILIRNSDYEGGESCLGNFVSGSAAVIGLFLIYLSIRGF